jgi:hypothetical protein
MQIVVLNKYQSLEGMASKENDEIKNVNHQFNLHLLEQEKKMVDTLLEEPTLTVVVGDDDMVLMVVETFHLLLFEKV